MREGSRGVYPNVLLIPTYTGGGGDFWRRELVAREGSEPAVKGEDMIEGRGDNNTVWRQNPYAQLDMIRSFRSPT